MNLSVSFPLNSGIKKNLFKLKPLRADGLQLNIHHSQPSKKVRFIHTCFNENAQLIVCADNEGNFYVVDFCLCKFWSLPKIDSCAFIKFSVFNANHLLAGSNNGDILILNIENGSVCGILKGHTFPVKRVSFSSNDLCLSTSQYESILWNLQTNTKIQVLNLEKNNALKLVAFIPISCYILACFQDDLIHVWNNTDFETVKQFLPINWNNHAVKSIAFTRNGQIMVVAGYLPIIALFRLDIWKLTKLINLPEYIHTVKCVDFVCRPFDGGCNKILAILSGQGIIYFYDIEQNAIISELISKCEINKMVICPKGSYIACILCIGEVEVYSLAHYVSPSEDVIVKIVDKKQNVQKKRCVGKIEDIKDEISLILDIDKLKSILKVYGQYPEALRLKIWEKLLQLPNNYNEYNTIINHTACMSFDATYSKYHLESKLTLKNLKKLSNNLVTWCPFFINVEYLPGFALPFVKILSNKPVTCFEAISTIIINWCQHWFEYFPLPPLNILGMIGNLLYEHDPELLHHLSLNKVSSNIYAWPLLQTAFSEVLISANWIQFWDHILSNEPSFLLCSTAAYSILHRNILLSFHNLNDFEYFYHNRNSLDMNKFLRISYRILDTTSKDLHPRQYLQQFHGLNINNYPLYTGYPKTFFDFQAKVLKKMDDELEKIVDEKVKLKNDDAEKILETENLVIREEQERRLRELEEKCIRKLQFKKELLEREQKDLEQLQATVYNKNRNILDDVLAKRSQNSLVAEVTSTKPEVKIEDLISVKEQYLSRLKELLKYKYRFKQLLQTEFSSENPSERSLYNIHQRQLEKEIKNVNKSLGSTTSLKRLNIATSVEIIEQLIKKVENELTVDKLPCADDDYKDRIELLQSETKGLEQEVEKLLELLSKDYKVLEQKNNFFDNGVHEETSSCSSQFYCPRNVVRFTSSSAD